MAKRHLLPFVQSLRTDYLAGWFHTDLAETLEWFLEEVANERSPRLMLFTPPRHGKSEQVSRYFPAWSLGRHPFLTMIASSYATDIIEGMSRDVQRIMDSRRYQILFPDTPLKGQRKGDKRENVYKRGVDEFEVVGSGGIYRAAGVGKGITGKGAHILNIDDPVKNFQEAHSKTVRDATWNWYTTDAYTRLAPGGGVLLTMTRWHQDDLAGRLLEQMRNGEGDKWRVLCFPAIAVEDEKHRKKGEALHPERWSLEKLERIKRTMGSYTFSALYQQNPMPDGGAVFKKEWIRYYLPKDLPKRWDRVVQSWDMAFKDKEENDFVVGQVWGVKGANAFLLDQVRERMSFTKSVKAVVELSKKWPESRLKMIEDKANGPAIMDMLKDAVPGFRPIEPYGNKVARAHAVTAVWESGNVYVPHPTVASWVPAFEDELLNFPASTNDDQVDAMTQALDQIHKRPGINISNSAVAKFMTGMRR